MLTLATIGYELATPVTLVAALREARIEILVDVRALANSRRPGFAKRSLTAQLAESGIEYLHLRDLGTPAEGRKAARAGRHDDLRRIFLAHMKTSAALDALDVLADLVESGRHACLLCLEANPEHCHRRMVAEALVARVPARVVDLFPTLP